jgi:hypothetical protein
MAEVTSGSTPPTLPTGGQIGTTGGQISAPTEPPLPEPDLKTIAAAWPSLPAAIKKAMMALVTAAAAGRVEGMDRPEAAAP